MATVKTLRKYKYIALLKCRVLQC